MQPEVPRPAGGQRRPLSPAVDVGAVIDAEDDDAVPLLVQLVDSPVGTPTSDPKTLEIASERTTHLGWCEHERMEEEFHYGCGRLLGQASEGSLG